MESATSQEASSPSPIPPRRSFFRWITSGIAVVAGVLVLGPATAYVLRTRKTPVDWIALGRVGDFPPNETRRVTFDNPIRQPWDGIVAHAAVYVRYDGKDGGGQDQFLVLDVNCAHLGCPGLVVSRVGLVHVPVSRRGLLFRRKPRLRSATARSVPLRVARSKGSTGDPSAALSHVIRHAGKTGLAHGTDQI